MNAKRVTVLALATALPALVAGWFFGYQLAEAASDGLILNKNRTSEYGTWRSTQALGSPKGDPILQAWIARTAILPLARSEVAYFFSSEDEDGTPLDPECRYRITVPEIKSRWWSVAAYDGAYKPILNPLDRYSVNSDTGQMSFIAARSAPDHLKTWLPLGEAKTFELLFRVYQPGIDFEPSHSGALPTVQKVSKC